MRRIYIAIIIAALVLSSCGKQDAPAPPLTIKGDVNKTVTIQEKDYKETVLADLIEGADVSGTLSDIYIVAKDGFAVRIGGDEAENVSIAYTAENGWSAVAPDMPVSTAAKDIDRIIIVSEGSEAGLSVTDKEGRTSIIGMGLILTVPSITSLHSEGVSEIESGGSVHSSEVFTTERSVRLSDIYPAYRDEPFAVDTGSGDKYLTDGKGLFVLNESGMDYREADGETYENVTGVTLR